MKKIYYRVSIFLLLSTLIMSFQNCSNSTSFTPEQNITQSSGKVPVGSCLFNGQTIQNGSSIDAFLNSTVPAGQSCIQEKRICNNGVLSGSNAYSTCSIGSFSACLFNGLTIAHGGSVNAHLNSTVPFGSNCTSQNRTCNNGSLSGSYTYANCSAGAAASCLFNGMTIPHNGSTTSFLNSTVPFGSTCAQQTRTCSNGMLSGTYGFNSCNVGGAASCTFNGVTVNHGQNVIGFQSSTVPFGSTCAQQTRTCNNGSLSGTYTYANCNEGAAASCLFNGVTIPHNGSTTSFLNSTVPFGSTCTSQTRICNNGSLSGAYTYANCAIEPPSPLGLLASSSCRDKKYPVILTKNTDIITLSETDFIKTIDSNYLIQGDNLVINIDGLQDSCVEIVGNNNSLIINDKKYHSNNNNIKVQGNNNILTSIRSKLDIIGDYNTVKLKSEYLYPGYTVPINILDTINIVGNYARVVNLNAAQNASIKIIGDNFDITNQYSLWDSNIDVKGNYGRIYLTNNVPSRPNNSTAVYRVTTKLEGHNNSVTYIDAWTSSLEIRGGQNNINFNNVTNFSNQTNILIGNIYHEAPILIQNLQNVPQ